MINMPTWGFSHVEPECLTKNLNAYSLIYSTAENFGTNVK